MKQRCINVVPILCNVFRRSVTLFRSSFNVRHSRCINVVQSWKSDVEFCFIFNVGSMLFQRWSTTLKQRWSEVEMLTGRCSSVNFVKFLRTLYLQNTSGRLLLSFISCNFNRFSPAWLRMHSTTNFSWYCKASYLSKKGFHNQPLQLRQLPHIERKSPAFSLFLTHLL